MIGGLSGSGGLGHGVRQEDVRGGNKAEMLEALVGREPLRAASFIVTVYGDVAEPRGGVLWMGTLIEICADVGLSETLVRTAVSRLVAAGQLTGERIGRRSYYRLTPAARREFAAAARLLFEPDAAPGALAFVMPRDAEGAERLQAAGFVTLGRGLMVGPDRDVGGAASMRLRAFPAEGEAALRAFAARTWDLDRHRAAYESFLQRFAPLEEALPGFNGRDRLVARLLMVHAYRAAVLRDPHLPSACLPADWPGRSAGTLFARLYLKLSEGADSHVGAAFSGAEGPLSVQTTASRGRLAALETYLRELSEP